MMMEEEKKKKRGREKEEEGKNKKGRTQMEYVMEFKAPVFQLETAIKNMSYTVDTFCKKMGNIEKCSNRLFYGLWLLLDIHENGKDTKVNIKKGSFLTKSEYAEQTKKFTKENSTDYNAVIYDEYGDGKPKSSNANIASSQNVGESLDPNSPVRIVPLGAPAGVQTVANKEKEAVNDIKRFMLYYMAKNRLDMKNLDVNFNTVKLWLETNSPDIPEVVVGDNNAKLHELYVKVFKTHGYFFGGMRDTINDALNTKLPKSQAIMAGVYHSELYDIQESHPFIGLLTNYENLNVLLDKLRGDGADQFIGDFDKNIKATLTPEQLETMIALEEGEIVIGKKLGGYVDDVTEKMREFVAEEVKKEGNTVDIENHLGAMLKDLQNAGISIFSNGGDEMEDGDNINRLENRFFKNNGFEKLRRDFFTSLEIEINHRGNKPANDDMGQEEQETYKKEQEKMKEFLKHYKDQEVTIDDKEVKLNTGCMKKHQTKTNPPNGCECCSVINGALIQYRDTSYEDRKDKFGLAALIKEIFDETVYILDDDNPLLRKVGENVKIDMEKWRSKNIMGGLLEDMKDIQRMEERKYRSWITSCLMPLNEDGSLFKNEYEHVFPVLFLFLFVGGYIHMPSTGNAAGKLKTELYAKLQKDEAKADKEYKQKIQDVYAQFKGKALASRKRLCWEDHRIKKNKIYKVLNLLKAIDLFPFNDYNYNLLKFMFGNTVQGNLKLLDYIVDTIFLFRESVLLCESDPNQYKSNAIYAKVSNDPTSSQLWSSSNQGITRFMIPNEQRIQAIDYKKSIEMNRKAKVTSLYAGNDTDEYTYPSRNMGENTGALSESLVNASYPIRVECDIGYVRTEQKVQYDEHEFKLSLPLLNFTKTKKNDRWMTIREFYTDLTNDIKFNLIPEKKLAFVSAADDENEVYFFNQTGNRVILKKGDSFKLIKYLDEERIKTKIETESQHVIESVKYLPVIKSPTKIPEGGSREQGTITIKFRCHKYGSNQFTSRSDFSGGKKRKKKRTKKKRRRKKKTRGKR